MQTRGANKYERQKAEDSCSSGNTIIVLYSTDSLFGRPDCIAPMIDYLCLMSKLLAKTFFSSPEIHEHIQLPDSD